MSRTVLAPVQQRGREALARMGFPTRREEAWRLTDLKRLVALSRLPLSATPAPTAWPAPAPEVLRLVLDGVGDPLEGVSLPEGVRVLQPAELEPANISCSTSLRPFWIGTSAPILRSRSASVASMVQALASSRCPLPRVSSRCSGESY